MSQRILAVDDEPHMLILLERIISSKTEYEIVTTNNALEISDILKENTFDLIISDYLMPKFNGLDVLGMVRENNRREMIILITAFGSSETAMAAEKLGVFDFITKPFRKEEIINSVERAMKWQRSIENNEGLSELFVSASPSKAEENFKKYYLRQLEKECSNSRKKLSKSLKLSEESISEILDN